MTSTISHPKGTRRRAPSPKRFVAPPADLEYALWFLNSAGSESDPRVANFKARGVRISAGAFRDEQSEYRSLVDSYICRKKRPTLETWARLRREGRRIFLEPQVLELPEDPARAQRLINLRAEDLKPFEDLPPDELVALYQEAKREGVDHPLLGYFVEREGRLDDDLSYLYDFLLQEMSKNKHRIKRCIRCHKYFYLWPQRADGKFCQNSCRHAYWQDKYRPWVRIYQNRRKKKIRQG